MLIAKGFHCRFFLTDPPGGSRRGAILLHDEDGEAWPYSSGLVVPSFTRSGKPCDDEAARRYYGDDYALKQGRVELPPKDITRWRKIGQVETVWYTRRGDVEPGPYEHEFQGAGLFGGGDLPMLHSIGPYLRLELGKGSKWNWRGIVKP